MKDLRALRRPLVIATALLVVGAAAGSAQGPAGRAKSFLWKVQSGERVLYLAGSVHALTADVYPLNPAFERAFAASDMLVEELNLEQGDVATLGPVLLAKGVYVIAFSYPVVPKGKARIRTQISATHTRDELERAVSAFAEAKEEIEATA